MNKQTIEVLEETKTSLNKHFSQWGDTELTINPVLDDVLSTAIQALKALESAEKVLGEKRKVDIVAEEGTGAYDRAILNNGFNIMHDIAKPIIAQRDLRIEELLKYEWEMRKQLSYLTPQGSEFTEFEECYNYIKEQLREGHEAKKQVVYERRELQSSKQELSQLKGKLSRESLKKVLENLDSNVVKTSNYYRVRAIQKECGIEEDTNDK